MKSLQQLLETEGSINTTGAAVAGFSTPVSFSTRKFAGYDDHVIPEDHYLKIRNGRERMARWDTHLPDTSIKAAVQKSLYRDGCCLLTNAKSGLSVMIKHNIKKRIAKQADADATVMAAESFNVSDHDPRMGLAMLKGMERSMAAKKIAMPMWTDLGKALHATQNRVGKDSIEIYFPGGHLSSSQGNVKLVFEDEMGNKNVSFTSADVAFIGKQWHGLRDGDCRVGGNQVSVGLITAPAEETGDQLLKAIKAIVQKIASVNEQDEGDFTLFDESQVAALVINEGEEYEFDEEDDAEYIAAYGYYSEDLEKDEDQSDVFAQIVACFFDNLYSSTDVADTIDSLFNAAVSEVRTGSEALGLNDVTIDIIHDAKKYIEENYDVVTGMPTDDGEEVEYDVEVDDYEGVDEAFLGFKSKKEKDAEAAANAAAEKREKAERDAKNAKNAKRDAAELARNPASKGKPVKLPGHGGSHADDSVEHQQAANSYHKALTEAATLAELPQVNPEDPSKSETEGWAIVNIKANKVIDKPKVGETMEHKASWLSEYHGAQAVQGGAEVAWVNTKTGVVFKPKADAAPKKKSK